METFFGILTIKNNDNEQDVKSSWQICWMMNFCLIKKKKDDGVSSEC